MTANNETRKVTILCDNGFIVKGHLKVIHGMRLVDFLNKTDRFIAVSGAEFHQVSEIASFKLFGKAIKKKDEVLLNKFCIKFIE